MRGPALIAFLALAAAGSAGADAPPADPPRAPATAAGAAPPVQAAVSPLVAASRAAKAAQAQAPPARKVWTLEDLEALERSRPAGYNVVAIPQPGTIQVTSTATPLQPAGVEERYREMVRDADAELDALERERLAAVNPLLRGMGDEKLRTTAQIDADRKKLQERRDAAARNLPAAER